MSPEIAQRANPILATARRRLEKAGIQNAYMEVRWLLAAALRMRPSILYASPELEIAEDKLQLFEHYLQERLQGRPLAYIVGEQPFYELDFFVNGSVLIPRPETEELVQFCLEGLNHAPLSIPAIPETGAMLDLGAGSGCIGLSLFHARPRWKLLLTDISESALGVAEKNAQRHFPYLQTRRLFGPSELEENFSPREASRKARFGQSAAIYLMKSDLFQKIPNSPLFDLIVSNPPYIHPDESDSLDRSVKDFEPWQALFCENPLGLYAALLSGARSRLRKGGLLWAELSPRWAEAVGKLAGELFVDFGIAKDSSGKDRFVYGQV